CPCSSAPVLLSSVRTSSGTPRYYANPMGKLTEQVRADLTEAMKARAAEKLSTLRMLQSALKYQQIETGHELGDDEALAVIRKSVKQRQDSIEQYTKGNRPELAEKERREMEILKSYMPPELSDDVLEWG